MRRGGGRADARHPQRPRDAAVRSCAVRPDGAGETTKTVRLRAELRHEHIAIWAYDVVGITASEVDLTIKHAGDNDVPILVGRDVKRLLLPFIAEPVTP